MSRLSGEDYTALLDIMGRLYGCWDAERLPRVAVRELPKLVGANRVSFEHIAPTVPRMWGIAEPVMHYEPGLWRIFAENLHEHPSVMNYLRTGDMGARMISEFLTAREWQQTEIYQRVHRPLDCEDQMAVSLEPPGHEFFAMVIYRDRRGFTERDREALNLLRPHAAQAYRNARALQRVERALARHEDVAAFLRMGVAEVTDAGRLVDPSPVVRRLLRNYFDATPGWEDRLPETLAAWIRAGPASAAPLVVQRGQRRVIVRCLFGPERSMLVLEERPGDAADGHLRARGLTRREREVLRELAQGRTNDQIAARLFISPRTVKKHLEHIFDKLGLESRAAAIAMLHRLT